MRTASYALPVSPTGNFGGVMKWLELITRACASTPGPYRDNARKATIIVLDRWPNVTRFTDEQLQELQTELVK